jgi:hypothetical protein
MPEAETRMGKYVYCIARCSEPHHFVNRGIGERGDAVETIHFRELAAVVSDSPVIEYESSRRNMMAHTLVLEEAMSQFDTMLPVRFGTVAPGEDAIVQKVMERRYGEFHGLLQEMDGMIELGLKAFWYEGIVFQELLDQNPDIRQLRDKLNGRTPEETYYERIRLGELIESAMWKKRDVDTEAILSQLRPLVERTKANKVIIDRMVLNCAFLLKRTNQPEFDQTIQRLDEQMGKRIIFKYVGPVPPYNFVNLVVSWKDD